MNLKTTLILFCTLLASNANASDYSGAIDEILSSYQSSQAPGLSVLAIKAGEVIYNQATGVSDIDQKKALQPNGVFRIGSVTKQFTAVAIMQLVENGDVHLQDDVREYIPHFMPDASPITIHQLLNHTSGLGNQQDIPNYDKLVEGIVHTSELVDAINHTKLFFNPGVAYSYSNLGYYVLGRIIEIGSGLTYEVSSSFLASCPHDDSKEG